MAAVNAGEISVAINDATGTLTGLENAVSRERWPQALEELERFQGQLADIAAEIATAAYRSGLTKREIADKMNIPIGYLRELKRTDVA